MSKPFTKSTAASLIVVAVAIGRVGPMWRTAVAAAADGRALASAPAPVLEGATVPHDDGGDTEGGDGDDGGDDEDGVQG